MPSLPSPADLLRTASTTDDQRWFTGNGYDSQLPCNLQSGDGADGVVLSPSWNEESPTPAGDIAYVMFRFGGFDTYSGGSSLFTHWQDVNLARVWIGLANFQTGHWDWYYSAFDPEIDPPSLAPYIAPDGSAFMTVLLLGTAPATLNWVLLGEPIVPEVELSSDQPNDPLQCTAPLTVNFDTSYTLTRGSVITQYSMDYDGDGTYDESGPGSQFGHSFTQPGIYTPTMRITDNYGHSATSSLELHVINAANMQPSAAFTPGNSNGAAPLTVNFNASTSSDPDGSIALYEWDFDNDGDIDYSSTSPLASHNFSIFGMNTVRLRVTDNDLGTAETTGTVNCTSGWRSKVVANLASYLNWQVGVAVEGSGAAARPCVSYVDSNPGIVYFVHGSDNLGTNWDVPVAVDTGGATHRAYSASALLIENISQVPVMSYKMLSKQAAPNELRFVRATAASGANWNAPVVVGSGDAAGQENALLEGGGHLLLASTVGTAPGEATMQVYRSTDNLGGSWGPATQVQGGSPGMLLFSPALTTVSGLNPLLAWSQRSTDGTLSYWCSSATSTDGLAWNAPASIPAGAAVYETHVALNVAGGKPILATGGTSSDTKLWFNRAGDAQGNSWPNPPGYLDENWVGAFASIAIVGGSPAVAYTDIPNDALKFIQAADANGDGWNAPQIVDAAGRVGNACNITVLPNNVPLVVYEDKTHQKVKAAAFY